MVFGIVASLLMLILLVAAWRQRGRRRHVGSGAMGAVYELLNEDRRNALEVIVEQKAEAKDPENRNGNLPDLSKPN